MGKSYKGNSEFGRKFKDQRKSKNKDCGGKNNRRTKQSDDQFMKSDQFESWLFLNLGVYSHHEDELFYGWYCEGCA